MSKYKQIKEIYDRERLDVFVMAVAYLLDIGMTAAQKITDEQIEAVEGNGLMTAGFNQHLVRIARDIAVICGDDVVAIIQFCHKEKVFDIKYFK